jgi:hypothetical protein
VASARWCQQQQQQRRGGTAGGRAPAPGALARVPGVAGSRGFCLLPGRRGGCCLLPGCCCCCCCCCGPPGYWPLAIGAVALWLCIYALRRSSALRIAKNWKSLAFDSKWVWVPPVGVGGRCPESRVGTRHTGTGGAADGVHAQCLRDSGAGEPGAEWCPEARSKQLGKQPDEAMSSSRGDARAAKRARTGGAKIAL